MTKAEQDESVPMLARYQRLGLVKDVRPVERAGDYAIIVFYPDDQRKWLFTTSDVQTLLAQLQQLGGSVN